MLRGVVLLAGLVLSGQLQAQASGDAAKLAEFKAFAKAYRAERGILSMSYAIAKDGRVVAAEGIGWQDHDAEEPTTADTSYLVASITR
jgi:CubicO group peptidase (beta-lactamase class C family)